MRLTMNAHIGDARKPHFGGGVDRAEIEEVQTVQEVLLDVTDAVLDPPLLITLGDVARRDIESPMTGEIQIAWIEHRRLTDHAADHGRLQIVDHQAGWAALKGSECMFMSGEEMLHGLGDGEFHIHEAAVTQHHDEERQPSARRAHANRAVFAPIDLGTFAGCEGEFEEGFPTHRTDLAYIILDDRETALETVLTQTLEDLLCAVRVRLQQTNHPGLERIEPAASRHRLPGAILRAGCPFGYRLCMQAEGARALARCSAAVARGNP